MEVTRKCPKCAEEIKPEASVCKHCKSEIEPLDPNAREQLIEEKRKEEHLPYWFVFLALGLTLYAVYWMANDTGGGSGTANAAPKAKASSEYYVQGPAIGCNTQDQYERAFSILINEEWEALARMVAAGKCTPLEDGKQVFIEDSSFSMVRVRPSGSTRAFWTSIEVPRPR